MPRLTPEQANQELLKLIMVHLETIQNGKLGMPTNDDLNFCGELHGLIEKHYKQPTT
ncbi:MAG: hypothetical protein Q7R56_01770 [Nanoarchaeota archaeon]|nr:hypothetical protein [Nanoarchaeota archaeon]